MVFFWIPFVGERFDQLVGNFDFRFFEFYVGTPKILYLTHLLSVIHGVQHQSSVIRTQENRVLAVVHG